MHRSAMKKKNRKHSRDANVAVNTNALPFETTAAGEVIVNTPVHTMDLLHLQSGDRVILKPWKNNDGFILMNTSVRILYAAKFLRNLQSLRKAITDPLLPLERVIINFRSGNRPSLVLLSADGYADLANKVIDRRR